MNQNSREAAWTLSLEQFPSPSRGAQLADVTSSPATPQRIKSYSWKQKPTALKMKVVTVPWSTEECTKSITFVFSDKLPHGQFNMCHWCRFFSPNLWLKQELFNTLNTDPRLGWTTCKAASTLHLHLFQSWNGFVFWHLYTPVNAFQFKTVKLEEKFLADTNLQWFSQ